MSDLAGSIHRFLGILGHELRNPIAAISMAGETLSHLCEDTSDVRMMIDIIRRQSQQASRLLEDVVDVSRMASGKVQLRKERTNLTDSIRRAVADQQAQFDAGQLRVQLEVPPEPIWVNADPPRLSQIFGNLINNAIKFSSVGGQISIRVQILNAKKVRVDVADTGLGIEPEAMAHIFEPFNQSKRSAHDGRGGLGLGLPLAKGFVELHGGSIAAESAGPGRGACLSIVLPLSEDTVEMTEGTASRQTANRPLSILIIDDSPDMVASLEFLLQAFGHQLASACDGKQGVSLAQQMCPDVIFCDIALPGMDGYAVARALRADPNTAPIYLIAMSGFGSEEERRRSLEAGFDTHLNKPEGFVGLNDLLQKLPIGKR